MSGYKTVVMVSEPLAALDDAARMMAELRASGFTAGVYLYVDKRSTRTGTYVVVRELTASDAPLLEDKEGAWTMRVQARSLLE